MCPHVIGVTFSCLTLAVHPGFPPPLTPPSLARQECTNIFSSGGGEQLSSVAGVPFLGRLPLEPRLAAALDAGAPLTEAAPAAGPVADAVSEIVRGLLQTVR